INTNKTIQKQIVGVRSNFYKQNNWVLGILGLLTLIVLVYRAGGGLEGGSVRLCKNINVELRKNRMTRVMGLMG
ncbi:hypothetical protein M0802_016505, partial [Mischocyttarus mexicanus]